LVFTSYSVYSILINAAIKQIVKKSQTGTTKHSVKDQTATRRIFLQQSMTGSNDDMSVATSTVTCMANALVLYL